MSLVLLLLLFAVVGLGNYLMRFLPLLFALQRRERTEREASSGDLLPLVGPAVVAALLVTSLLPESSAPGYGVELTRNLAALVPTLFVALKFGNLGLTVLTGVFAYALASVVL
jgi:branched-subunit amino acid transport protein